MKHSSLRLARDRWRPFAQMLAVVVLAAIDLHLAELSCDPMELSGSAMVFAPSEGADDPLSDFCVLDCFCCATALAAGADTLIPEAIPIYREPGERAPYLPAGESSSLYHPPELTT